MAWTNLFGVVSAPDDDDDDDGDDDDDDDGGAVCTPGPPTQDVLHVCVLTARAPIHHLLGVPRKPTLSVKLLITLPVNAEKS